MKLSWPKLFVTIVVTLTLVAVAAFGYLHLPLFGKLPNEQSVAQFGVSPNFRGGQFVNQIDSPLHTNDSTELSIFLDSIEREKGRPRPPSALPAIKTDLKALDPREDLVIWLGHSSYYVQLGGKRILIDPVFSQNAAPIPFANEAFEGTSIYKAEDVPAVDLLLISHDHYDHLDYPTVEAIREKVGHVFVGLGVGAHFAAWGYNTEKIVEADWYQSLRLSDTVTVTATPARHFSGRTFDRNRSLWVGFVLQSSGRRLFFSGDSGYGPHFAEIGKRYGPFDWAALDMGQYDPRWANVHMNPEQAAVAADEIGTQVLTPGHVGRFSISPHDWNDPFIRIVDAAKGHRYALWTPIIGVPMYLDKRPQSFGPWWESVQ